MERYYSFPAWCMEHYGKKLYKIPLDAGMTCPNRDGTINTGGCIFCDEGGSGDFASYYRGERLQPSKMPYVRNRDSEDCIFIGYFQAYTNTYAPIDVLEQLFTSCLLDPCIAGISIATRPDCLPDEVLSLLKKLLEEFPDKFIWVELGLQSIHESTAEFIHRGYTLNVFNEAVEKLHALNIPVIVHVILGLPFEIEEMMYQTIEHLNALHIEGIKLQLLHVLKNTKLSKLYNEGVFDVLTQEEYLHILCECIARLNADIAIHRLTGDGNPEILEAPLWSLKKKQVLNAIGHALKERNYIQGCKVGYKNGKD